MILLLLLCLVVIVVIITIIITITTNKGNSIETRGLSVVVCVIVNQSYSWELVAICPPIFLTVFWLAENFFLFKNQTNKQKATGLNMAIFAATSNQHETWQFFWPLVNKLVCRSPDLLVWNVLGEHVWEGSFRSSMTRSITHVYVTHPWPPWIISCLMSVNVNVWLYSSSLISLLCAHKLTLPLALWSSYD